MDGGLFFEADEDVFVGGELFYLGPQFAEEGEGRQDSFVGADFFFDGVVLVADAFHLLLLLLLQLGQPDVEQTVLFCVLGGLLAQSVVLLLLFFEEFLGAVSRYLDFFEFSGVLEVYFFKVGLEL